MNYMTDEVNSTTKNIIKKVLNLNTIIKLVCEGKGENFSYIKDEEKSEYMELIAPILNKFEIKFEEILKIDDGVKQYKEFQLLNEELKDMGVYQKSLSGTNILKMYKRKLSVESSVDNPNKKEISTSIPKLRK